ncbi:putative cellulase [Helianthus anomalus]
MNPGLFSKKQKPLPPSYSWNGVKWVTYYLIKAHPHPPLLYGVGDANTDHYCWQRPEDMTTSRNAYRIDQNNPGSDFARETAATMATAPSCSAATILLTPESSLI